MNFNIKRQSLTVLFIGLILLLSGCSIFSKKESFKRKFGEDSVEYYLYSRLDIEPAECVIEKEDGEGKYPDYEVTTEHFGLDKPLTFRVFSDASTTVLGTTLSYWESDIEDSLLYALYPEEN
ncbi:hypothetical protein [Butyrivibrio sp.]|uniref:hypothetical protein n=1 Tax=Butyrivibrio sp. TaxID=28121 RepID=UPI0025C4AEA9|nr:hypothetical protein [Butyrivibrio sp.]MBQ9304746.1 hypothetical protein [Butyrivibrio sp.]